jgi:putative sigma-54 modulation protein
LKILTTGRGVEIDSTIDAHIRSRINFALCRFSGRVKSVSVFLTDNDGPRGERSRLCRILVQFQGLPTVAVEQIDFDIFAAVERAAERAGRTVAIRLDQALVNLVDM